MLNTKQIIYSIGGESHEKGRLSIDLKDGTYC